HADGVTRLVQNGMDWRIRPPIHPIAKQTRLALAPIRARNRHPARLHAAPQGKSLEQVHQVTLREIAGAHYLRLRAHCTPRACACRLTSSARASKIGRASGRERE